MSSNFNTREFTTRDQAIMTWIDRMPLTTEQLFRLSQCFSEPYTSLRAVQLRLQKLKDAGWIKSYRYATKDRTVTPYFRLTPAGYRLLHGDDAVAPRKRHFSEIGVSRHVHTRCLSDAAVHLVTSAAKAGFTVTSYLGENSYAMTSGNDTIYPDGTFEIRLPNGQLFYYMIELDNSTKTLRTQTKIVGATDVDDTDRIEKTLRVYLDNQEKILPTRFRVLYVTTQTSNRHRNILDLAKELSSDRRRTLFYGIDLATLLACEDPIRGECFLNHHGETIPLVGDAKRSPEEQNLSSQKLVSIPALC